MTFEKTYDIQKDNQLIIQLPERFRSKKRVKVIVEEINESRQESLKAAQEGIQRPIISFRYY
jgi:hypothetical protein